MAEVNETLTSGIGFALIDRLPLEDIGEGGARAAHWLLCSMVERPVAQNFQGDLIYDVTDTRPPARQWRAARQNQCRAELPYG